MRKKEINIGIVGFGTVGSGVVKVLRDSAVMLKEKTAAKFIVKRVVDIDIKRRRGVNVSPALFSSNIKDILEDKDIQVVVELTGSESVAMKLMMDAMSRGKHVVTANKAVLAKNWNRLFAAARKNKVGLYFEASVGAGIPVIQVIREGMAANRISQIFGIVNGTTNYVLSRMRKDGWSFSQALNDAAKKGFAEPDPSLDIGGFDSMHKLIVLSSLAFGKAVDIKDVYVEGIDRVDATDVSYGEEFGYMLKLLAIAKENGGKIEARVHPTFLPREHLLSSVEDEYNAIYIVGDLTGPIVLYGKGAGQMSAASAVVADLMEIGQNSIGGCGNETTGLWEEKRKDLKILDIKDIRSKYYLRFSVIDSSGVLAKISNILGRNNISIAKVIQKEERKKSVVPVVMMTHIATERNVLRALSLIGRLGIIKAKTVLIRVEDGAGF